jgi:hypothetical protein
MKYCVVFIFMVILTIDLNCQTFVKQDAKGANNGKSWKDAYVDLDTAISKTNSGEIWVAAGTYKPTISLNFSFNPIKSFYISKKIALYGGFKGIETEIYQRDITNNPTVLSGDIGEAGNDLDNTPIVVFISGDDIDSTTILDGFTITKSYYKNGDDYQTGAVLVGNSNPVIRNCTIKDNFGFEGGGISIYSSNPLIYNNLIINNTAYEGAGIYIEYSVDSAHIIGNKIINNKCTGGFSHLAGGGIYIGSYSAPFILNNLISQNSAGGYGGGIAIESNYSAILSKNIISNNSSYYGGGIYVDFTPTFITNCLIANNIADYGGGLYVDYCPMIRSINNTIINNSASSSGDNFNFIAVKSEIINSIVAGTTATNINYIGIGRKDWFPKIQYSNIEGGNGAIQLSSSDYTDSIWKIGNISTSPLFVNETIGNYNLSKLSDCINAGISDTTGLNIGITDLNENPRILYDKIDIGCFEFDSSFNDTSVIEVSPKEIFIDGWKDTTLNLSITTDGEWQLISGVFWIEASKTSGIGNSNIALTIRANTSNNESRNASIFIAPKDFIYPLIPVSIEQSSNQYIDVSPDTVYLDQFGTNNPGFTVYSNLTWYISVSDNWYTLNKYSGSNTEHVLISTSPNKNSSSRFGSLSVRSFNGFNTTTKIVTLIQHEKTELDIQKIEYSLSPNPVRNLLNIKMENELNKTIAKLYSSIGELVYSHEFTISDFTIEMSTFKNGLYYLQLENNSETVIQKIIKF